MFQTGDRRPSFLMGRDCADITRSIMELLGTRDILTMILRAWTLLHSAERGSLIPWGFGSHMVLLILRVSIRLVELIAAFQTLALESGRLGIKEISFGFLFICKCKIRIYINE